MKLYALTLGITFLCCQTAAGAAPHNRTGIVVNALPYGPEAQQVAHASRLLGRHDILGAQSALGDAHGAAAALVRARIALAAGNDAAADRALDAAQGALLAPWVNLTRGQVAQRLGRSAQAVLFLEPLVTACGPQADAATLPLAQAQCVADPQALIARMPALLARFAPNGEDRDPHDDVRSQLLEVLAQAHERVGDNRAALAVRVRRYLTEPNAPSTPQEPPLDAIISAEQALGRIEAMVQAHRNGQALLALTAYDSHYVGLPQPLALQCRRAFAQGMAARKLHRYSASEQSMGWVMTNCPEGDLVRRAAFVQAKVISISDPPRALAVIEAFAARYPEHSMTDDVLFWAGDGLQRRDQNEAAASYYKRILSLPQLDDQCVEAGWRLAWMAYTENKLPQAAALLQQALTGRCPQDAFAQGRSWYWLGRIAQAQHDLKTARFHYQKAIAAQTMGFYAQQAMVKLLPLLNPRDRQRTWASASPPESVRGEALCTGSLMSEPALAQGLGLLQEGLNADAAAAFMTLPTRPLTPANRSLRRCGPAQSALLVAQLLDAAEAHRAAYVRLLRDFAVVLNGAPWPGDGSVWRTAYPLAYRDLIATAERVSGVPDLLLQALAREESGFDSEVVSWAEAHGLTQLMLAAAQTAGRRLRPPFVPKTVDVLHDPATSTRLGGALLGYYGERYHGSWPLALAAYNGGQRVADAWWKRFGGQEFALFAEQMTVRETRSYVQRVLQTHGIYRWLYGHASPGEPLPSQLPPWSK